MSQPEIQFYDIEHFTFSDGTGPTTARLAYLDINPFNKKVALISTCFRGRLASTLHFGDGSLKSHRIIVVALFGNGESSSPSQVADGSFPSLDYKDCVRAQHLLLTVHLGIESIDVALGFSMGGQCTYYWTLMHPDLVRNAVVICSSSRTSRHNYQFLEGPKAALTYSADYSCKGASKTPSTELLGGLRAFGKAYSAWLTSPEWFEKEMYRDLGYKTLKEWDEDAAGRNYSAWHPNDLLVMIDMWQKGDISSISEDNSLQEALAKIKARVLLLPCSTDQYFRWEASKKESCNIAHASFSLIPSAWGHLAGLGYNALDKEFVDAAISRFLKEQ